MYCEFGRSFNEHTKRSETERGSDVESQMSEVGKRLRSENRWELLQEKRTHMKLIFLERGIPVDFVVCSSCAIAKVCDYASGAKDAHPGGIGKKSW